MNKINCVCYENIKKYKSYYIVAVCSFIVGFLFKMLISSPATVCNAATVDVQQLINNSFAVQELQAELAVKQKDLQEWLQKAQTEISKTTQKKKKEELVKKYDEELAQKQKALQQEYAQKLSAIDSKVTKLISNEAKVQGFGIVLSKNSVISGGTDITKDVIDLIK